MSLLKAGFCGSYCGKCEKYPGICKGCNPIIQESCEFVKCCNEKNIPHCGFCDEFPCDNLKAFKPAAKQGCPVFCHLKNLEDRLRMGTRQWLKLQENTWGK